MGLNKSKRPILSPKGLQVGVGGSTFTGKVVLSGSSARMVLSNTTQAVAAADATLSGHAVQFITVGTSGSGREIVIPAPSAKGEIKYLFVNNATTSVDTRIHSASAFWATTYNTISISGASTGSPGGTPAGTPSLTLVAVSTSQWALICGSTFNWDLSATTGSTSMA